MSVIRTWKQYDKAIASLGCEVEYKDVDGDTATCIGNPCDHCGRGQYCMICYELLSDIEDFESKQLIKARAQSKRKKSGGK